VQSQLDEEDDVGEFDECAGEFDEPRVQTGRGINDMDGEWFIKGRGRSVQF